MMIDMKELLKTVLRFAIWAMLFIVTMFAGMIVLSIIHPSVWQGSEQAATEYFKDSVISGWINLAATLLFIILFLVLRWASLSKGILERSFMWKLVGLLLVLTVADICFEVSLIDLPAYHNLFPETWAEMEADNSPDSGGITKYLYACLLIPIFEEIGFRGVLLGGLLRAKWHHWLERNGHYPDHRCDCHRDSHRADALCPHPDQQDGKYYKSRVSIRR